jgi:hypothetical protein
LERVWAVLTEEPSLCLGDGVNLPSEVGEPWQAADGSGGSLRSRRERDRIRLTLTKALPLPHQTQPRQTQPRQTQPHGAQPHGAQPHEPTMGETLPHETTLGKTSRDEKTGYETTVQVTVSRGARGTLVRFHQERMLSAAERETQRLHWLGVMDRFEAALDA